jgi:arylsulfate sulfotransferase
MKVGSVRFYVLRLIYVCGFSALLTSPICSEALTITSKPSFTPGTNAPLAGTLQLTTDVSSRVSISVNDGTTNVWQHNFYDYSTAHTNILLGFKSHRTNSITVIVHDQNGNAVTNPQPLVFITAALPADFPTIVPLVSKPDKMEPGYTLFRGVNNGNNKGYLTIVDSAAQVVWYSGVTSSLEVRQLANGDLWIPLLNSINEINMLGNIVKTWILPTGKPYNHESYLTDHGSILYLSDATRVVTNFPANLSGPNAPRVTTNVWHQPVIEVSATNAATILNIWQFIDMIDPRRAGYLTFSAPLSAYGIDWSHANAITEDKRDNSLVVSLRHQNAVIKFSRATGQLKWILGTPADWSPAFQPYLLTQVGTPFEWQYGQHAPHITPQGTWLIFDDGNYRAMPFLPPLSDANNYSRAVEYQIDEDRMEVSQVWQYGASPAPATYSVSRGDAEWMNSTSNILITYADTSFVNGLSPSSAATNAHLVRIQEVTHDANPEIVFDFELFDFGNTSPTYKGYAAYRSYRIRDLYPTRPVTDLSVQMAPAQTSLHFTGDDARLYLIQASADLKQWDDLATVQSDGDGNVNFNDEYSNSFDVRYYRVQTLQ